MRQVLATLAALALAGCATQEPPAPVADELRNDGRQYASPSEPWSALPALAGCDAHLATTPAEHGRVLQWEPCPAGPPGCRALLPDEPLAVRFGGVTYRLHAGWTDRGVVVATVDDVGAGQRITLAPLDGPPFLVLELRNGAAGRGACSFMDAAFDRSSAAIGLVVDRGLDERTALYLVGRLHPDVMWHSPAARLDRFVPVSLFDRTVVTTHGPLRRSDWRTGEFADLSVGRTACCGSVVGTSVVYVADGREIRAAVAPDKTTHALHHASEGAVLGDLHRVEEAFFWARGIGTSGDFVERVELWTADATDDPARFAPRKLADLDRRTLPGERWGPVHDAMVVGGGKVAMLDLDASAQRVHVVDVASGVQRVWQPGPEFAVNRVVFVGPDELGVEIRLPAVVYLYMRIPLDTLALAIAP